jgi:hypothetical protein
MPSFIQGNQSFEPGRPGGEVRFAVGRVREQSAIWKVVARPSVVVMSRGLDKEAKFTLHRDGKSWLAAHLISRGQQLTGKPRRELVGWTLPAPNAAGWVHAMNVWVPHGELNNVYTEDEAAGDIIWLDPAEPGHRVGVHLVLITPTSQPGGGNAEHLASFRLSDGRVLLLARTHLPYTDDIRERIEADRRNGCVPDEHAGAVSRCLVGKYQEGRTLDLWDLASPTA